MHLLLDHTTAAGSKISVRFCGVKSRNIARETCQEAYQHGSAPEARLRTMIKALKKKVQPGNHPRMMMVSKVASKEPSVKELMHDMFAHG